MKQLVDSGASILLVAHAMDQILLFCEEAIWLERGRIVLRGPSLEVVKAYEEFIHTLQDRQLKAANRQRKPGFRDAVEIGHFADNFVVALIFTGAARFACRHQHDRAAVRRQRGDVRIGDLQDSDASAFCLRRHGHRQLGRARARRRLALSQPAGRDRRCRECARRAGVSLLRARRRKQYAFRIRYRTIGEGRLAITVSRNGNALIMGPAAAGRRRGVVGA